MSHTSVLPVDWSEDTEVSMAEQLCLCLMQPAHEIKTAPKTQSGVSVEKVHWDHVLPVVNRRFQLEQSKHLEQCGRSSKSSAFGLDCGLRPMVHRRPWPSASTPDALMILFSNPSSPQFSSQFSSQNGVFFVCGTIGCEMQKFFKFQKKLFIIKNDLFWIFFTKF